MSMEQCPTCGREFYAMLREVAEIRAEAFRIAAPFMGPDNMRYFVQLEGWAGPVPKAIYDELKKPRRRKKGKR